MNNEQTPQKEPLHEASSEPTTAGSLPLTEALPNQQTEISNEPSTVDSLPPIEQPVTEPTIINPKSAIETMEVHHHPQLHHKEKPWKEYLLECLMIFVAVSMGFIAENIREYISDKSKEMEYIHSMIEDLDADSAFLKQSTQQLIPFHSKWLDSAIYLLSQPNMEGKDREIYQAVFLATSWTYSFHPTERTLSQLHTQGFHLITKPKANEIITELEQMYRVNEKATSSFIESIQNDIDISSYAFADKKIMDKLGTITFQNFTYSWIVKLDLKDVPVTAKIDFSNKVAIKDYVEKLRKYSYYLQTCIINQQIIQLRLIKQAKQNLAKEYHLSHE